MRSISVVSILLLAFSLAGCIPIGVRGSTMPYASLARPFDQERQIAKATDEHGRNAGQQQGADLKSGKIVDAANAQHDGHRA